MCAVKRGHHCAAKFLLQQGSPIELRDYNHRTCLHVAVYSSEAETLKILIQVTSVERFDIHNVDLAPGCSKPDSAKARLARILILVS